MAGALQAKQQVQEVEGSTAQLRQQLAQAQHAGRGQEILAEKLRERLADRIQTEDRRTRRAADAYVRLQRAMSVAKGADALRCMKSKIEICAALMYSRIVNVGCLSDCASRYIFRWGIQAQSLLLQAEVPEVNHIIHSSQASSHK